MTCSKRSSSDSAAIVEGNEDLLIEILLFLPAKPLVKFKAVSKKWSSLISSPCFCRRHTIHHCRRRPETQHAFIFGRGRSAGSTYRVCDPTVPRLIEVEFDLGFPHVEILQSCNGLLLLRCRRTSSGRNHYYVFNPTTMQRRDLPPLPFTSVSGTYLIFDPSLSPHYRVVCFVYAKTSTHVYLYDSEIHEWKLEDEGMPTVTHFYDGIYFSGGINFLRFTSSYRFTPDDNLTKIPPLPQIRSCGGKRSYAHSNGALVFFLRQDRNVYHVCEMKEIESGWTNKYEVDMKPILDRKSNIRDINLLCVIAGEKEEDLLLVLMKGWKLMAYRFHEAVFEVLADLKAFCRDDEGPYLFRNAHHFIQTLALV